MNSQTNGIFSPGGLLARMESEGECENCGDQSSNKVIELINLEECTSGDRPTHQQLQNSSETLDQCTQDVDGQNSTLTSNAISTTALVPLRDLPPIEAAFSIEKISTTIFSHLNRRDLLQCRLVSSSWRRMATSEQLLKLNKCAIRIKKNLLTKKPSEVTVKGRSRRLEVVKNFLDAMVAHPFLFSVHLSVQMTIAPKCSTKFLDTYGFAVNSFDVTLGAKENGEYFVYQLDALLEFVTKLLTEQMPNLETLDIEFQPDAKLAGEINLQLLASIKKDLYFAGRLNYSLRTIVFGYHHKAPHEILETICCLAPKLEELVSRDLGFWVKYKHRLCLLKTLDFMPCETFGYQVDALEAILDSVEKLGLKKLEFCFSLVRDKPQLWPRLATLLTRIIKKSFHSLEELSLSRVNFFPGTVLPRMPKLKRLSLVSFHYQNIKWNLLPPGTSIASTFPTLHTIGFYGDSSYERFLSLCKDEEITSVNIVRGWCWYHAAGDLLPQYFPNAKK